MTTFRYYLVSLLLLAAMVLTLNVSEFSDIFTFMVEDFLNIFHSTFMTFAVSFIAALLLLAAGILLSWIIYKKGEFMEKVIRAAVCFSTIPSVLALIVLSNLYQVFPGPKTWNFFVIVAILAFLNLTFLFVFTRLNRQLQQEFHKPYHYMTRQLAGMGIFRSSLGKIMFIIRESFKSIMILTFSATVFLESRIGGDELYKGIYSYYFSGFRDTHAGRKFAILLFILLFLMVIMGMYTMVWSLLYKHQEDS